MDEDERFKCNAGRTEKVSVEIPPYPYPYPTEFTNATLALYLPGDRSNQNPASPIELPL